jgi:hypothetical protein
MIGIDQLLAVPQSASMLIVGGIAATLHFGCGMSSGRRCDPGRLIMFAASAAGMVAGVYVFSSAMKAALSPGTAVPGLEQNSVWAGLGGLCVAIFTLDLLITELKSLFRRAVDPFLTQPRNENELQLAPRPDQRTTRLD